MLWIVRRVFRALRAPLRRPLEPLLWVAATLSAKDVWVRSNGRATLKRNRPAASPPVSTSSRSPPTLRYPPPLRSSQALPSISGRADGPGRRLRARGGAPLLIIAAQAQLDGTRWQVIPAYCAAVTCTAMGYAGRVGLRLPAIAYRTIAAAGAAGAALSTAAGLFAPVFPMPKPTGPYRVGKTTRMWIDRARRSWLLKTRRKTGKQPLPEHRMMMANVWYPAADANPKNKRHADESAKSASKSASKSSTRDPQPWPEDEEAKAMFAAYFARRREDVSPETAKHQERYDARLRAARRRGERRRAHWMEPLLATTLAESFELPGWVVDYFRLVKMEATTDAPVANPPRSSATTTARATPGVSRWCSSATPSPASRSKTRRCCRSSPAGATWWWPSITRTTPRWCSTRTDRPPIFEGTTCPANSSRGTGGDFDTNTRVGARWTSRTRSNGWWTRTRTRTIRCFERLTSRGCPSSDTPSAARRR